MINDSDQKKNCDDIISYPGKKSQIPVFFRGFGIKGNRQQYHSEIPLFIMLRLKDIMAILLTI
jgi:hypothetical protein